jgi:hypothetical protein
MAAEIVDFDAVDRIFGPGVALRAVGAMLLNLVGEVG